MPYDPSTDIGRVRLLINDTADSSPVFNDTEIQAFLDLNAASVKRAAAEALGALASNEALLSKVITTQDLSTDGSKVSAALLARAADLRKQADAADDNTYGMDIVDFDPWAGYRCGPDELAEVDWLP